MRIINNQNGYTLVELLISTTIFSVILLGAAASLLQINKMYYKGVIASRTQETSRKTIDEISRNIQFSDQAIVNPTSDTGVPAYSEDRQGVKVSAFCVGNTRYTYALNAQVNDRVTAGIYDASKHQIKHALWRDTVSDPSNNCIPPGQQGAPVLPDLRQTTPSSGGTELLEQSMRLSNVIINDTNNDAVWKVSLGIIYGDDDLLSPNASNPQNCKGSVVGGQWCAVSMLSTQVFKRIQSK